MKKNKFFSLAIFTMFLLIPFHVFAMQISVESDDKDDVIIEVESSDTIDAVKLKIEEKLEISPEKQILSYSGKKLDNGRTLGDYNIKKGDKIQVTLKTEVNIVEFFIDDPQEGKQPDTDAKVVMSNEFGSSKLEIESAELEWYKLSEDMSDVTSLQENDVFEKSSKYIPYLTEEANDLIVEALENSNYVLGDEGEIFFNGNSFTHNSYFYIGGVKTLNEEVDKLIVDEAFPKTLKYVFTTDNEIKELLLDVNTWIEIDEFGNKVTDATGVVEAGKKYLAGVDVTGNTEFEKYISMMDIRTKTTWNGTTTPYYIGIETYKVTFEANGGTFKDDDKYIIEQWNNEYYDNLVVPTRQGYKFIGYFNEKTGGTKFEMILNESGIDDDMTFYAQWEKINEIQVESSNSQPEEENPKTFDGIGSSIFMGTISLIGLVGATIYLKNKVRA